MTLHFLVLALMLSTGSFPPGYYMPLKKIFLYFLLVSSGFKTALKKSAEMRARVPKHRKAAMCLMEKVCVLDGLHSGMSYRALGYKFNVNEFAIYIK